MDDPNPRVRVPAKAGKGDIVEIKTLISHPMETGQRKNEQGEKIPRRIINRFECALNGRQVFAVDLQPAISMNPYLVFDVRVTESGTFEFTWIDDDGSVYRTTAKIEVS
ncbi:MAG: thiosulfate oxidation carrier complex protein SoxZ [Gammaproteobacteria bacterium]|nr:thiosulfate oxidation carrier complex protein SoxZ [Gammaproteobacteria bacterium]